MSTNLYLLDLPYPNKEEKVVFHFMGKKTVNLDELLHQEIENIQRQWVKKTGENPPSKEEVIQAGIEKTHDEEILEGLFQKKKQDKKKKEEDGMGSRFDDLFSI